jgi:Flp pilus assembly protein TadG
MLSESAADISMVTRRRRGTGFAGRQEGAAAVEFAVVASLLLLIVFGIIQFGMWLSEYQVMSSAAREGARLAAVRGTAVEVQTRVSQAATPYTPTAPISISLQCTDATIGQYVTVSWTQNMNVPRALTLLPLLPDTADIKGVFRCE